MQRRSGLAYWTQDYRRFYQQTRPTRTRASRILRLQSINRARTANRRRGNARAVRAPLTSACACIARSSLRASLGYAGRRRRPPNRKEISPASTQAQTSNNCPTPSPKLPPSRGRQRVTWRRSSPRISPVRSPHRTRTRLYHEHCIGCRGVLKSTTTTCGGYTCSAAAPPGLSLSRRLRANQRPPSNASKSRSMG